MLVFVLDNQSGFCQVPIVSKRALEQGGNGYALKQTLTDTNSTDGAHMFMLGLCLGWMTLGALVVLNF